jgi:long-chain acyl-CoA synthetase
MSRDPLLAAFESVVRRSPGRVLVASADRIARAAELDALSRRLAARLEAAGLPPDTLVALKAPNGPAFLVGFLALRQARAGTAFVDASAPEPEARRIGQALGASALLSCATAWPGPASGWSLVRLDPPVAWARAGSPLVKVTSGSTGSARGVLASVENVLADESALHRTMGLCDDERIVAAIPLSHSYGFSSVALPALVRGSLLALPEGGSPLAPIEVARSLDATFFPTAPAYVQALVRAARPEAWPRSLRLVVSAGALLPAETARAFGEIYRQPVHAFYGASECGGICYDREGSAAERGSVGTPVDGVRVSLARVGAADASAEGTVVVESDAVALGYLPTADHRLCGGRFETSDRAAWRGSELELRGRSDDVINVRGRKVDPAEVERVLRSLEGIADVAVIGVPSAAVGDSALRAFVICDSARLTPEAVLAHCRGHLASYKVPRSVRFVRELPRTSRGKLDRRKLMLDESEVTA